MHRHALINEEKKVINVIVWDEVSVYEKPKGTEMIEISDDLFIDIGYVYDGSNFVAPTEVIK